MWSDIESLQRLAKLVPFAFIVLGFLVAVFGQFAKTRLEDRVKQLQRERDAQREAELRTQLDASHRQVVALEDRVMSATARVEATLSWDALGNSNEWKSVSEGSTGYVAFARGEKPLIVIRSRHVIMKSTKKGEVLFTALCDINAPDSEINCSVTELRTAEFMQVGFPEVPDGVRIISGTAAVTINGSKKVNLPLDPEAVSDHKALTRSINLARDL